MTSPRAILVVNRTPGSAALLVNFLNQGGCQAACAGSLEEIDQAIDDDHDYGLALLDVSGFDTRIWDRCSRLLENGIPFLLISSPSTQVAAEKGLRHGARGILKKPLVVKELAHLIDSLVS